MKFLAENDAPSTKYISRRKRECSQIKFSQSIMILVMTKNKILEILIFEGCGGTNARASVEQRIKIWSKKSSDEEVMR